jgi:glycerophosphoryl diester phosphodiesterase
MHKFSFLIFAVLTHLIGSSQEDSVSYFGHRGCRGLYPENTIVGFQKAIALGVDGIEWDVVVNKDKHLVISHDQFFEKEFCLMPDGSEITDEKATNIYQMTQDQIEQYDCGTKVHKRFLEQQKIKETKPLLKTVFDSIDFSKTTILFEIKSDKDLDGTFQPAPAEYVSIILKEIEDFKHKQNIIFMSFDARILEELHQKAPNYRLVYLTESPLRSTSNFVADFSFKPYAVGIFYPMISKANVKTLKKLGIKTFAWTVNDPKTSKKLVEKGVDGIITDYPNLVKRAN